MEQFGNKASIEKGSFTGHETFPLRQGWPWKAYAAVRDTRGANADLFSDASAIARFGVGKNMVSAIRHWAISCGVIEESDGNYLTSRLGDFLMGPDGLDPYLENQASIWLFQWLVAGRSDRCTTWYWAFNHYPNHSFDRESLIQSLARLCRSKGWTRVSEATLKRDVDCFIRSYSTRLAHDASPNEEAVEPVLAELGLLRPLAGRSAFAFRQGSRPTLPDEIFNFALHEFWARRTDVDTLSLDTIAYEPGSPGRVFKLDVDSIADRLSRIEDSSRGIFGWTDTAGIRHVIRRKRHKEPLDLLISAYGKSAKRAA